MTPDLFILFDLHASSGKKYKENFEPTKKIQFFAFEASFCGFSGFFGGFST